VRLDVAERARQVLALAQRPVHDQQVVAGRNPVIGQGGPGLDRDRHLEIAQAALEQLG